MMNNKILIIGIMILAGMAFAIDTTPGVGTFMLGGWCAYEDGGEDSLADNLYHATLDYDERFEGDLDDIWDSLGYEWGAMMDCTRHKDSFEVAELTPVEDAQELLCVSSHYAQFNRYMSQMKSIYFRAAFNDGADWLDILSQYQSFQQEWAGCFSRR